MMVMATTETCWNVVCPCNNHTHVHVLTHASALTHSRMHAHAHACTHLCTNTLIHVNYCAYANSCFLDSHGARQLQECCVSVLMGTPSESVCVCMIQ